MMRLYSLILESVSLVLRVRFDLILLALVAYLQGRYHCFERQQIGENCILLECIYGFVHICLSGSDVCDHYSSGVAAKRVLLLSYPKQLSYNVMLPSAIQNDHTFKIRVNFESRKGICLIG